MKKVIIIVLVLIMVFGLAGFTYMTEEAPEALINELVDEGFIQDKNEENIWVYEEDITDADEFDRVYIYAWFDTDENVGVESATMYIDDEIVGSVTACVTWDSILEDWEILGYRENGVVW